MVTVGAWFREGWVPENLLADHHAAKKAQRKRAAAEELLSEASGTKRVSPNP